jgi:hypothetical protein
MPLNLAAFLYVPELGLRRAVCLSLTLKKTVCYKISLIYQA